MKKNKIGGEDMEIKIKYNNGIRTYRYKQELEGGKLKPIEVRIAGGKETSREVDMVVQYLHHLGNVFKGVVNSSIEEIEEIEIKGLPFGEDIKQSQRDGARIGKGMDKYSIVIYDITSGTISETMYMTRNEGMQEERTEYGTEVDNRYEQLMEIDGEAIDTAKLFGNELNKGLMSREGKDKVNILQMMAIVERYIPEYKLKWNDYTKKVQLMTGEGQVIGYDELEEDDIYTFFKLYSLIVGKGEHNGVFMINAVSMTQDVLKGILAMIELAYGGEAVVFMYRANYISRSAVKREEMLLPNYKK